MEVTEELKKIGLNKSESKVYMYLLENGLSFSKDIAESTEISHTNVYNVVKKLEDKKMIDEQEKDGMKAYLANSPKSIVRMIERKKERAENLVDDLEALHNKREGKPQIKFYDGWEQVKELFEQQYDAEKVYTIGSTKQLWSLDRDFFDERIEKLKEKNVIWHDVLAYPSKEETAEIAMEKLGELLNIAFLPKKFGDMSAVFYIWDDKTVLLHAEEPVFATVIINKNVSNTLRKVIDAFRDVAPEKLVYQGGEVNIDKKMRGKLRN